MSQNQISLVNSYLSRFYFHYEVEIPKAQENSYLEVSLDSKLEPEKRNVFRFDFKKSGNIKLNEKIPLTDLINGSYVLSLCLFDSSSEKIIMSNHFPLQIVHEIDPMIDFIFDYQILQLSVSEIKGFRCKVLVKNLGRNNWGEDCAPCRLSFRLEASGLEPIIISSDLFLTLESGKLVACDIFRELPTSKQGIYKVSLDLESENVAIPYSGAQNQNLHVYLNGTDSPDEAQIHVTESSLLHGKFITIKGTVKNTGDTNWYMGPNVHNPYLLGIKIYNELSPNKGVIGENRFRPDNYWYTKGEGFEFLLTHELKEVVLGSIKIELDMVRESAYWFQLIGSYKLELILASDVGNRNEEKNAKNNSIFTNKPLDTVLFIAPSLPLFDRESGGLRMFEILKALKNRVGKIVYFYRHTGIAGDPDHYLRALEQIGVVASNDLNQFFTSAPISPDVIIHVTWECAETYLELSREVFPSALVVVDSVDLHWKRERRAIDLGLLDLSLSEWENRRDRENAIYLSADVVWLVTDEDRFSLEEECPGIRTMVVSNVHGLRDIKPRNMQLDNPRALFIGHFRHPPNVSAGIEAANIVLEYNKSRKRKITIDLIGDNAPDEINDLHDGKNIFVRGHVPDLSSFEENATFLLAPLKYGAGIKGKICEAISAGLPILTTDIGNEGIDLEHQKEVYIANDTLSSLSGIDFILEDKVRAETMVKASREKLRKFFSRESIAPIFDNFVDFRSITIAIVTYDQKDLLERCLNSLFSLTKYPNFKVIVWSNGCTDGTLDLLKLYSTEQVGKFQFVANPLNDYFVRPNNAIIRMCSPDDVVLLNNDTEIVDPFWLHELNFSAYMAPRVGAAGCMVLGENGKILEAGAQMNNQGIGINLGRGDSSDNPTFNKERYVDYVSGCCLYMKRSSIDLIGALDEDFHPMYYEDSAWQFSLRKAGYRTVYTPRTSIIHKEGSSAGTDLELGMKKFQNINREKFMKKFDDGNK